MKQIYSGAIRAKKRPFAKPKSQARIPIFAPSKGSPVFQPPLVPLSKLANFQAPKLKKVKSALVAKSSRPTSPTP